MSTAVVYQINNAKPLYVGTLTLMGSRLNMAYNRENNATNASTTKINNMWNARLTGMNTYYTA